MALVDMIEELGQAIADGKITLSEAAGQLGSDASVGLTYYGASHVLMNWKGVRAEYTRIFDSAEAMLIKLKAQTGQ